MPSRKRAKAPDPIPEVCPTFPEREFDLIAIDPGDKYTGVAFFATDGAGNWACVDAQEFSPHAFEDALAETLLDLRGAPPPIVVFERWRLYEDHAQEKKGSEFETSQHIGVIKYLVRVVNDHADIHDRAEREGKLTSCEQQGRLCADPAHRPQHVTIFGQLADIKKPTAGICRHKKIKSVAKPIAKELYRNRDHIVDAELHGWCYILEQLNGTPAHS